MKNNLRYTSMILIIVTFVLIVTLMMTNVGMAAPFGRGKPSTNTPTPLPATPTNTLPAGPTSTPVPPASYYVDCSAGTNGNGEQASPWNNVAAVNGHTFVAGDQILFKRGTTCSGALWPLGSGASGSPITMDAYGTGALPIINGGANQYAIKLSNQSYWQIQNLETTGGTRYGIFVTSTTGQRTYFRLNNLVVHDVNNGTLDNKATGLVVFTPTHDSSNSTNARLDDIVIDNVTAYNTNMWAGIIVGSGTNADSWAPTQSKRSSNVTIRNSVVHDVYGDGIILFTVNNGLIENSVAYRSGIQPSQTIGTPNGIWTWACQTCTVQGTEGYLNDSPGVDGGAYDIDYFNNDNILQYNYGHDNSAYCFAVLGAGSYTTTNSIVRYNVCSYNGYNTASGYRDIHLQTWSSGTLNGVMMYNNTFYTIQGLFKLNPSFTGTLPNFFKNNLIYSTVSDPLGLSVSGLTRDYNLWYYTGGNYTGSEPHSIYNTNPMLNDPTYHAVGMPAASFTLQSGSPALNAGTDVCAGISGCTTGGRDFWGNAIPQGGAYDIGAYEGAGSIMPTATPTITPGGPTVTPTSTPTPGGTPEMHVADIITTDSAGSPKTVFAAGETIYWRVKIVDQFGNPVSGASVTSTVMKPSGPLWVTYTFATGSDGWALFNKGTQRSNEKGVYTANVTDVVKTGTTYNPAANVKSSTTFTLQ